ncbi:hypothetical protein [Spiroplasma endosymbiont of Dilophus febrilis]|uniref:hypothetical protein n=1 Tax=Spiroplasma endosymbiont of Dilophus febrilis TaxID=3066292 RepID=UPI00313BCC4D
MRNESYLKLNDGFKVSWELELIDIKTLDENKKISPWGDPYPLQIFYLNEYLINFNIQFINPTMENKSLILQEAIMNNVQADITKLDVVNFSGIQGNWLANDIENMIKDLSITISGNEFLYSELFNLKNLYIENIFSYEKRGLDHILWIAISYEELDIFILPIKIKIYPIKQSTIIWRQIYKWAMLDENNNRQKPRIKQFLQASRMRQLYESDITLEKFNWLYLGYISYHWKKIVTQYERVVLYENDIILYGADFEAITSRPVYIDPQENNALFNKYASGLEEFFITNEQKLPNAVLLELRLKDKGEIQKDLLFEEMQYFFLIPIHINL